jgi:hypothetical protein
MANSVVEQNEIFLNGVYYPTTRPVRSTLASIYPAKVVIGDTTKDSNLRSSVIAWSDWRGGIGINRMEGAGEVNRAWYSTCQLRYKNHLVLPGLATVTANVSHSLTGVTIGAINTYEDAIYVAWNGTVSEDAIIYKYNNTSNDWGNAAGVDTTADQVTDSVIFTDNSGGSAVSYLVFAHYDTNGSNYTYYNGTSWVTAANGVDTKFVTVWDERLWGISHAGQLWYATTIGTETLDAKLPAPSGSITKLFVARNAAGIPIIYAATTEGLFAHNADNAMWEETQMAFPTHPDNGKGTVRWRDSVYIPSGNGIYKYINGNNAAVITIVGPDRDDGLPTGNRGAIRYMAGTHNELLVGLDARSAPTTMSNTSLPYRWVSHHGARTLDPTTGNSTILGYNEMGWEVKWESSQKGRGFDALHVSSAYSKYRVWWGHSNRVYFMEMPKDIINPSEVGDFSYATSGVHETPWFNAGQSEVEKLALNLRIEAQGLTANETVTVQYALDYVEAYSDSPGLVNASVMGAASGTYPHTFKDADENPVGKTFRAIKFKITLARSTATTTGLEKLNTPDVVSLTLEYRKKIAAKWGHTVDVDLTNEHRGNVPKDLRASLISAIESTTLVEFTFRDDAGLSRNYYVDVVAAQGMEFTGHDERGSTTIQVVEP